MGRTGGKEGMAIGIAHPPGSLAEIVIKRSKAGMRKKRDKDEMEIITDPFIECAAGVSCATI
jgi:hypothetical protein